MSEIDRTLLAGIEAGDLSQVRAALNSGANPNGVDDWGRPFLQHAIELREPAALRLLLEAGADPNTLTDQGEPMVALVVIHHDENALRILVEHGARLDAVKGRDRDTVLHGVVAGGDGGFPGVLLELGAPVNAINSSGYTPLHFAAAHGYLRSAQVLLDAGADPLARTTTGMTPIDAARRNGHAELAALLQRHAGESPGEVPTQPTAVTERAREVDEQALKEIAARLVTVPGVVAVVLGGSRARGTHRPDSDIDLGLYYRGDLDLDGLRTLAAEISDEPVELTEPGGWGPWVDGGGWLAWHGRRLDWIYRDLDRVHQVWADCQAGRFEVASQPGHPLGFYSYTYAGELALCRVLADPTGEVAELGARTRRYPPALGDALVAALWEADFGTQLATYGALAGDPAYAAGCLFRTVGVACHALHGHARRWLINEKGMVASAGSLACAPERFAPRAQTLLATIGLSPVQVTASVAQARDLVAAVRAATEATVPDTGAGTGVAFSQRRVPPI